MGALNGTRVVDIGRFIAGPWCAALLGDLGADVIRVERPDGGEDRWVTPILPDGTGALYLQCNRGKRSLTLDLAAATDKKTFEQLLATTDVLVANLPGRALERLGLDYATLAERFPSLIAVQLTAWGSSGPWQDRIGFDGLAQAASGAMHLSGPPGHPTRTYVPYVDFATATAAALGVVIALRERDRTGRGQLIEGSLFRTALQWNCQALIEEATTGAGRASTHNRSQTSAPADAFRTSDGWLMCTVIGSSQFQQWCDMVGRSELVDDPRFGDDTARGRNGQLLSDVMAAWCAARTTSQCLDEMGRHRVPGGPILSPAETIALEQTAAINALHDVPTPDGSDTVPVVGFPIQLSHVATPPGRAPRLGEHNDEILAELRSGARHPAQPSR